MSDAPHVFNAVKLIREVRVRPALYNSGVSADRETRLRLWKEVGAALYADWDLQNKSTVYDRVIFLQTKWRSLRDGYNRELRSLRTGVRTRATLYKHFKRMSFLGGFEGELKDLLKEDLAESGSEESEPQPADPVSIIRPVKRRKAQPKPEPRPEPNLVLVDEDEPDSDKLFLLSFLPELRQLPRNSKMWVRTQIASIMQQAVYDNSESGKPPGGSPVRVKRSNSSSD